MNLRYIRISDQLTVDNSSIDICDDFHILHEFNATTDLLFLVLLVSLILFILVHINDITNIITQRNRTSIALDDNYFSIKSRTFIWSKVMVILSISLILTYLIPHYGFSDIDCNLILIFSFLTVSLIFILRHTILKIIGHLAGRIVFYRQLRYEGNIQIIILSLTLTPLVILFYCVNQLFVFTIIPIVLYCISHEIRTIKTLLADNFSFFELFLYLCALETLPIIAVATAVKMF